MPKGSCLCGAVALEIRGAIHGARFCHCDTCRKFSGTCAAWGVVRANELVVTRGASGVGRFDSGGGLRVFCATGGSPLWYEPADMPAFRGVPLGVVDQGAVPEPTMHVRTRSRVPWAAIGDHLPQHETHP